MDTIPLEPRVITLPEDPVFVENLRKKLVEYERRAMSHVGDMDTLCKRTILRALLDHGRVDAVEIATIIVSAIRESGAQQDEIRLEPNVFRNAWCVINIYVQSGKVILKRSSSR